MLFSCKARRSSFGEDPGSLLCCPLPERPSSRRGVCEGVPRSHIENEWRDRDFPRAAEIKSLRAHNRYSRQSCTLSQFLDLVGTPRAETLHLGSLKRVMAFPFP